MIYSKWETNFQFYTYILSCNSHNNSKNLHVLFVFFFFLSLMTVRLRSIKRPVWGQTVNVRARNQTESISTTSTTFAIMPLSRRTRGTQIGIFSLSCMKNKLSKKIYKLHCANEKHHGVKWTFPVSKNSKQQPKGNQWKWISLTLNDWMCDKISTWGKFEHGCLRSFAFNKMLSKEIEYYCCYWGQVISWKQRAPGCANLLAFAMIGLRLGGSSAPKCGSGAKFHI